MKLRRYRDTPFGTTEDEQGEFLRHDDVLALLQELSNELVDLDVIGELDDPDLNGSALIDQYIMENK